MVKDYANRPEKQKQPTLDKRKITLVISVMVIVFAIAFPLTSFYFKYQKSRAAQEAAAKKAQPAASKATQPSANTSSNAQQQAPSQIKQFDFYTLLPKTEVPVTNTQPTKASTSSTATQAGTYVLHVSSLKNPKDAENLRDQLVELGFHSFIQSYQGSKIIWYRVMAGPYLSLNAANKAQKQLSGDHMDSVVLQLKAS